MTLRNLRQLINFAEPSSLTDGVKAFLISQVLVQNHPKIEVVFLI